LIEEQFLDSASNRIHDVSSVLLSQNGSADNVHLNIVLVLSGLASCIPHELGAARLPDDYGFIAMSASWRCAKHDLIDILQKL
jgi:hypothetical protein